MATTTEISNNCKKIKKIFTGKHKSKEHNAVSMIKYYDQPSLGLNKIYAKLGSISNSLRMLKLEQKITRCRDIGTQTEDISECSSECSSDEHKQDEELVLNHTKAFNYLIKGIFLASTCKCGMNTKIKGTTALRILVKDFYPEYLNSYFSIIDSSGNLRSDIDIMTCMTNYHNIMIYLSSRSTNVDSTTGSSFNSDSEMIKRFGIRMIINHVFTISPRNINNSSIGLIKEIKISIDFCIMIKIDNIVPYISHHHRSYWIGLNSYGIMPALVHSIDFFSIRGLIEYAKMIIHENKIKDSGLTIIPVERMPLKIQRAINEGDMCIIRNELIKNNRSYSLLKFSNHYHNLSISIGLLADDEYISGLYMRWLQSVVKWKITVSCSKKKEDWIKFIRDQLEWGDCISLEPFSKSSQIVVRACGHISDHIEYFKSILPYFIYKMNRSPNQPPSYEELSDNCNTNCPICREPSFYFGKERSDMNMETLLGKDIVLSTHDPRFIHPIS